MSTLAFQRELEPCLARLGTTPEGNREMLYNTTNRDIYSSLKISLYTR